MNREEMINATATTLNGGERGDRAAAWLLACKIIDAILPQVTTLEQIETLPSGTVLVTPLGRVWKRSHPGWNYPWCDTSGVATSSASLAEAGPLTVVWSPT